jgi:hypothetical protein
VEEGVNVPDTLENDMVPVGEAPVTVAVHVAEMPRATTPGEHASEVTLAGRVGRLTMSDGASATEA